MPVEIIETKEGYYIPMDGPWNSKEDDMAYAAANRKYKEAIDAGNPYVSLIKSHHEYSHGYWIETKEKKVKYPDLILNEHKK
jgi:hypothetical protein